MRSDQGQYRRHYATQFGVAALNVRGWIEHVSRLEPNLMLFVCVLEVEEGVPREFSLRIGERIVPIEARCMPYRYQADPEGERYSGMIIVARPDSSDISEIKHAGLVVTTETSSFALAPPDFNEVLTDLRSLLLNSIMGLSAEVRTEINQLLVSAAMELRGTTRGGRVSPELMMMRELLRERLPACVVAPGQARGIHIDAMLAVDETAYYMRGWARDTEATITHLTAVSPEGSRIELPVSHGMFRYPRSDVQEFYGATSPSERLAKVGLIRYFESQVPSFTRSGWLLEMRNAEGEVVETTIPPLVSDPLTVRDLILADLALERSQNDELVLEHTHPAISRLQKSFEGAAAVKHVEEYGTPNPSPSTSIVIPLYRRVDFLEHQLAQFVHDPEIRSAELIYVLDSPELAEDLRNAAPQLFRLYGVPFRLVTLERNVGYSAANNVGASLARGRHLLLMNSDVFPSRPGWLSRMEAFYTSTPGIGALGPKLLYEDATLQHAGMYFTVQPGSHVWENAHYFKGLDRCLPDANRARAVPGVTGACMLIDAGLYKDLGGLRGVYVQGDCEDSDLCLRLIEAGYENWYMPEVELYHLEGQSYPLPLRQLTFKYNTWLQTRLWSEQITAVMERYASTPGDEHSLSPAPRQ